MIKVRQDINELKEEVIAIRRKIHASPELGFKEFGTSELIREYFEKLGADITTNVAGTGVIVDIKGSEGEKCYAFRADMDALSIEEKTGLKFASTKKGMMHACGHDAHAAILAGYGKYLIQNRHRLVHNVRLIFQPAEEGPGGALPLINAGSLQNPRVNGIIGLHLFPEVEEGKIGILSGPMMAQTGEVYIDVTGRSSHGAQPHKGRDALVAACQMVIAFQTIVNRSVDPLEPAVFTLGRMTAGERQNVVAGSVLLEGTIRAFTEQTYNLVKERIEDISKGMGQAFGCQTDIRFVDMYPAVNNDGDLFTLALDAVGEDNADIIKPVMLAEDFSYYQKEIPGLFFMLGVRNEGKGLVHPLHSCYFNFNEEVMMKGIEVYARILERLGGISVSS